MKRCAGVLLAISSLPSNYGIGDFGKNAYRFIDDLKKAKQKLPMWFCLKKVTLLRAMCALYVA